MAPDLHIRNVEVLMTKNHIIKDPVCGMEMKPKEVQVRSEHQEKTYYFCSSMCKERFDKEPEAYADKAAAA